MSQDYYKKKYLNLRSKFLTSIDLAWRDGYEAGFLEAQQESMMQQMQAQEQMQAQMASQMEPQEGEQGGGAGMSPEALAYQSSGQPGSEMMEEARSPEEQQKMAENVSDAFGEPTPPMNGELGKNIDKLMSMLSKGNKPKIKDLRSVVEKIDELRKKEEQSFESKVQKDILETIAKIEEEEK